MVIENNKLKQNNRINMDYDLFDNLGDNKSHNKLMSILKEKPHTFEELSEKSELDRTSVFYYINIMEKEKKITKKFIGKIAYIGLKKEYRSEEVTLGNSSQK